MAKAKKSTTGLTSTTAALITRKRKIYAQVARFRRENAKINEALLKRPDVRVRLPQLLCW
jgi:hypothetical protein